MNKIKHILTLLLVMSALVAAQGREFRVGAFMKSVDFESAKNYSAALKEMVKVYKSNKTDYLTNLRMGWLYYLEADYNESVKYYKKAIELSNNAIEARIGLTYPYSALQKWDEIKKLYEGILRQDKLNYTANLRLGQIYLNSTDYSASEKYLTIVYKNYPSDYEVNLSLGWLYIYIEQEDKAKKLLENALIANPGDKSATEGLEKLK